MGAEIVAMLLGRGANVAAVARRIDRVRALGDGVDESRFLAIKADITAQDAAEGILRQLGDWSGDRLDIVINNAGHARGSVLETSAPADLRTMIETNVWGLIDITRLAIPLLKRADAADIVEARKRVFVDLLKWGVPVLDGTWELDQFDNEEAIYIVIADAGGRHLGSARLLYSAASLRDATSPLPRNCLS